MNRRQRQDGIGLLEVLLAVVLLSIGFLATARMQVQSLAYSQHAYTVSQAKYLVLDMSERMRANRTGLRAGLYDGLTTAPNTSMPACVTGGTSCSAAERVAADRHVWSEALHPDVEGALPRLPSSAAVPAVGRVTLDTTSGAYQVSVTYADRQGDTDAARQVAVQIIPASLP